MPLVVPSAIVSPSGDHLTIFTPPIPQCAISLNWEFWLLGIGVPNRVKVDGFIPGFNMRASVGSDVGIWVGGLFGVGVFSTSTRGVADGIVASCVPLK